MNIRKNKIDSLDSVKGIACIFVVLIHCTFPGVIGEAIKAIARFAVPLFFSVTGFFLVNNTQITRQRIVRKCLHIIKIIIPAEMGYLVFRFLCYCVVGGRSVYDAFIEPLKHGALIRFFITNSPSYYPHLWFLYAMVYSYVFLLIIEPYILKKKWKLYYVIISLMSFTLISEILPAFGYEFIFSKYNIGLRNLFILRALPFIIMGMLLREHQQSIIAFSKYNKIVNIIGIIFFAGVSIVERFLFVDSQFYLSSYFIVALLFIYCIRNTESCMKSLKLIGRELSLYIYIIQYMIIEVLNYIVERLLPTKYCTFYDWIKPFVCIVFVIIASMILMICSKHKSSKKKDIKSV